MKAPATLKNQIAAVVQFYYKPPEGSEPFRHNGHETAAEARRLAAFELLPEERALIVTCRTNDN